MLSGIDEETLKLMDKVANAKPDLRHGLLSFDDVYVNPRLDIEPKSEIVFGLADDVQSGPQETVLAKTVLVFQYVALFSTRRFAINVGWYGCSKLTAETLELWLWDVLIALQRYGFRVHALVCDGHGINRKLQKLLLAQATSFGQKGCEKWAIDHPLAKDPDVRLFILSDPSHAIRKLRNNWQNTNRHLAILTSDNCLHDVKWDHLRAVQKWQESQDFRMERRLTKKHLDLTQFEKMTVQLAVDVMSEPIGAILNEIDGQAYQGEIVESEGTRHFMGIGREFWLCTNDRRMYFDEAGAARIIDGLAWVADELRDWKEAAKEDKTKFLTNQTYDDVMLISEGFPEFMRYVWEEIRKHVPGVGFRPRVMSQDPLESVFGDLRQRGGGTHHIAVRSIAYNIRSINFSKLSEFMQLLNIKK